MSGQKSAEGIVVERRRPELDESENANISTNMATQLRWLRCWSGPDGSGRNPREYGYRVSSVRGD